MEESPEVIAHDFNLPNHNNELSKAGDIIEKLKHRINITINIVDLITDKQFVQVYEELITVLDYVGRLSMPAFAVEEQMAEHYKLKYLHSPELGKQLWLDHYENVHRPYTILKNRCFKLLDDWDKYYKGLYDKDPPNWKP